MKIFVQLLAVSTLALLAVPLAFAGDCCCAHCGRAVACDKVCRIVPEERKINVVCWGGKCEDFCLPGKSCRGEEHCEEACDPCAPANSDICVSSKPFSWFEWCPGCSNHIYTRKKLMRKTEVKKVPGYKWVVEEVCADCQNKIVPVEPPPGVKLPPAPLPLQPAGK